MLSGTCSVVIISNATRNTKGHAINSCGFHFSNGNHLLQENGIVGRLFYRKYLLVTKLEFLCNLVKPNRSYRTGDKCELKFDD